MSGGIRRWSAVVGAIVAAMAFAPAAHANGHGRVSLDDLKVERKAQPLGIDVEHPRFSWVVGSKERDTEQRSYRVKVSTRGKTVWDSGTVRSRESSDVAYDGPALAAATRYDWRVEVVTNRGSADASSTFRTGLNADADWAGSAWIGNARTVETNPLTFDGANWIWTPEATTPVAPAEPRAFRFALTGGGTAEIIITADDSYKLWVNGKLLGETAGAENEWQGARRFTATLDAGPQRLRRAHDQRPRLARRPADQGPRRRPGLHHRHGLEGGQDLPRGLLQAGLRRRGLGHGGRAGAVRQRPVGPQRARAA